MLKAIERFIEGDSHGIHYAVSIFFATAVLWVCVHELAKSNRFGLSVRWSRPAILR